VEIRLRGLQIRDGITTTGALNFDLDEILGALRPLIVDSMWRCRDLWFTSQDELDVPELERKSESDLGVILSNEALADIAPRLLQVIDGEFAATRPDEARPWLIVRAVDSSWWEIFSEEPDVLDAIRARFTDLTEVDEVPQN
jgi:hypothetical protein